MPDLVCDHRDGLWTYSNGKMSITPVDGYVCSVENNAVPDEDGALFLPFLGACAAKVLLSGNGTFSPLMFVAMTSETPGHPCVALHYSLIFRQLSVDEMTYFFDDYSAVRFRILVGLLSPPPSLQYTSARQKKSPFTAVLALEMKNTDGRPIRNNFLNIKMTVSRL